MAWNRKKKVRVARGVWMGRLVVASVVLACLSLWYVWLRVQMVDIGYQMRDLERHLSNVKKENQLLRMKISQMKSPMNIEAMIRAKEMNLTTTRNGQVIVLPLLGEAESWKGFTPQARADVLIDSVRQAEPPARIPMH